MPDSQGYLIAGEKLITSRVILLESIPTDYGIIPRYSRAIIVAAYPERDPEIGGIRFMIGVYRGDDKAMQLVDDLRPDQFAIVVKWPDDGSDEALRAMVDFG